MRDSIFGARAGVGRFKERADLGLTVMTEVAAPPSERKQFADTSAPQQSPLGSSRNNSQQHRTSKYNGVHFSTSKKRWLAEVATSGKKW